jgi:hypothetical protein
MHHEPLRILRSFGPLLALTAACSGADSTHADGSNDAATFEPASSDDGASPSTTLATTASTGTSADTGPDDGNDDEATSDDGSDDEGSTSTGPELPSECDDGIDNDGDGYADWHRDLGCYGPGDRTEAALPRDEEDGFTTFEIPADSLAIYVSNEGDDANDGLSPETAVRTISHARDLIGDGAHDFILLRRGDTWRGTNLGRMKSGLDAAHPLVISSYGESMELPRIELEGHFINHDGQAQSNVAILGLHFVSLLGDPDDPSFTGAPTEALRYIGGGSNLLVEGCHFEYAGIVIGSYEELEYADVELRRNVIERAYHENTCTPGNPNGNFQHRPSGVYTTHVQRLTIEGNVFDHNGWNPDEVESACATIYNHNMYVNGHDMVIRDNILARASSIHIKMLSDTPGDMTGTVIDGNLFVEGEIGVSAGGNEDAPHRFVDTRITRNVMTDIGRSMPTGRTLAWAIDILDNDGLVVSDNLVLNNRHPDLTNGFGLNIGGGSGRDYQIEGNLFWRLRGRAIRVYPNGNHEDVAISDNEVVDPDLASALVEHRGGFGGYTYTGNRYASSAPAGSWFSLGNAGTTDIAGWRAASGEADAMQIAVPDYEDRDLEGYAAAIGAGTTLDELLEVAHGQNRLTWREDLTAPAINAWIREGFGR